MVATGALGAATPWYPAYATRPGALDDQPLGDFIMWIPGGTVYAVAALLLVARGFARVRAPRPLRSVVHGAR